MNLDHHALLQPGNDVAVEVAPRRLAVDAEEGLVPTRVGRPARLVDGVRAAADELHWVASPRVDDPGHDTALAPLNEVRRLDPVTAGLLVLRPGATYPVHSHPPQELYLPIADGGRWRYGGDPSYRTLGPDTLVYNHPDDLHSIIAGDSTLLALYVLWS